MYTFVWNLIIPIARLIVRNISYVVGDVLFLVHNTDISFISSLEHKNIIIRKAIFLVSYFVLFI